MKKTFLFLTVFLFFAFLSAEEVKNEPAESQPQSENAQKTDSEAACSCDDSNENNEKPEFFYIQPAIGFGTGMSLFRPITAVDIGFLVGSVQEKTNVYLGLQAGFKYFFWDQFIDLPLQLKTDFNFKLPNQYVDYLVFWISLGVDLNFAQDYLTIVLQDGSASTNKKWHFSVMPAWGTGVDLIFKNSVVLRFGIESFLHMYPELIIGLGYRF